MFPATTTSRLGPMPSISGAHLALPSLHQPCRTSKLTPSSTVSCHQHMQSCLATIASRLCSAQLTSGAQPGPASQPLPAASLFSHFVDPPAYVLLVTTAAQSHLTQLSLPQEPNAVLSPSLRQPCQAKPYSHCLQHQLTYLWQLSHLSRTQPVQCC